jgi:hypothetical protein
MKKVAVVVFALVLLLTTLMFAPAFAAKPTVVEDIWFVGARKVAQNFGDKNTGVTGGIVPDRVWSTDDGKILHNMGTVIYWNIMRSPATAGTVQIGSMETLSNFVFDTVAGKGTVNMKVKITLIDAGLFADNTPKNPYGVGTLEGTLIAEVTTVNPYLDTSFGQIPGYGTGFIVTTHGTGAFEHAKLTADLDMTAVPFALPSPPSPAGRIYFQEFIFFGTHRDYLDNEGVLTYHNPGK